MKVSALAFAFFVQQVAANKKSKAGSASGSVTSCPNFSSSSKRSGASKQSKAGFAAGTADCGSGSAETVRCGDSFHNEKVYLLKDLVCDGEDDTITLRGEHAVLDCGGRTIIGRSSQDDEDVILELRDGASVINCNFIKGFHAIETFGDNVCTTIENIFVEDTGDDGIRTQHSGTVVIRDVSVRDSYDDGIDMRVDDGKSLHAILENVRSYANGDYYGDGLDFNGAFDCEDDCGDIVVDFYGNIFLWDNYEDNLDANTDDDIDIDITVFGNLFAGDSYDDDGVDVDNGNTITFAAGSFSEICDNDYQDAVDLEYNGGRVFVEEGAVVICDEEDPDNNKCTDSCDLEEALACVE